MNVSEITPQNVRDHVYYTGAESKSFIQWRMCLSKMGVDAGVGVWVRRGAFNNNNNNNNNEICIAPFTKYARR